MRRVVLLCALLLLRRRNSRKMKPQFSITTKAEGPGGEAANMMKAAVETCRATVQPSKQPSSQVGSRPANQAKHEKAHTRKEMEGKAQQARLVSE